MLYLFAGDDAKKKYESYEKFLRTLPKGGEVVSLSKPDFTESRIRELYSAQSLFSPHITILSSGVVESEAELVRESISRMAESSNTFIFLEGKLAKPVLHMFEKAGASISLHDLITEKKEKFNNFLLANALGVKDKLNLWIYFRQAINSGASLDELAGILFWKVKDMITKRSFHIYTEAELGLLAERLSYLLPAARLAGPDAEEAFEEFLLEAF